MIKINEKEPSLIYLGDKAITSIYTLNLLIWTIASSIVLSCYYNGYWMDENPWTDDTPWTD